MSAPLRVRLDLSDPRHPALLARFAYDRTLPNGSLAREWVTSLPERRWRDSDKTWAITGLGRDPGKTLAAAGVIPVDVDGNPVLLDAYGPWAEGDPKAGRVLVYPGLWGMELVGGLLGPSAVWQQGERAWLTPVPLLAATPWCVVPRDIIQAAVLAQQVSSLPPVLLPCDGTQAGLAGVPVVSLGCVGPSVAESMYHVGITSVRSLLYHLPFRWVDLTKPSLVAQFGDTPVAVVGRITKIDVPSDRTKMVKVTLTDEAGDRVYLRWFHAPVTVRRLQVGERLVVFGTPEHFTTDSGFSGYSMTNPLTERLADEAKTGLIPIYPASGKHDLSTWQIRSAATEAIHRLPNLIDPVPEAILAERGLPSRTEALRWLHAPDMAVQTELGRHRLAYDELLRLQLVLLRERAKTAKERGCAREAAGTMIEAMLAALPYPLTGAQARCVDEIRADLSRPEPMHRLLQGEVGSGKTLVIAASMLHVVEAGAQAALMVPTEILALQHAQELRHRLSGVTHPDGRPVTVGVLAGAARAKARRELRASLAEGSVDIVVGTHALLSDDVKFADLGLAVVDEQHRFGVNDRAALRDKGRDHLMPDMLYASATPIPRTLVMTVFGDLDESRIDQMPPGRSPTVTRLVPEADPADTASPVWAAVRQAVDVGRQVFVVCPAVTASATKEAAAVHETAAALAAGALQGLRIGTATGKQAADERLAVMADFSAGRLDVLVATTVVEVGVDVPNATVMVILGADRFGTAQLHQLRGRVGRGSHAGTCILVGQGRTKAGQERLDMVVKTASGYALAEADLVSRGSGNVTGVSQSGSARDLVVADLQRDTLWIAAAQQDAKALLDADPSLAAYPALRDEVDWLSTDSGTRLLSTA